MLDERRLSRRAILRVGAATAGAGITASLLAACGGQGSSSTPTSSAGGASAAANTSPGNAKGGQVNLTSWFTDRASINKMTQEVAFPEFQSRNAGTKAELQFVPEAQIQQKLLAARAANNAPDVTSIDETYLNSLWKNKALLPIPGSLIDVNKEMGAKVANLYKLPPGDAQGNYFALPNGSFGGVLYYNADLLAQLKYKPEDIPQTWDDFIKWAKEVTVWKGNTLERTGFAIYGTENSLRDEYRIQKGGWQDGNVYPTKDRVLLSRDLEYEAVQWLLDFYDVHKLDTRDGVTYQEKFGTGRAVTTFAWTWNNGFFETQYKMNNYGTKLSPQVTPNGTGPFGASGPDVGFAVTTQSTNQAQVDAAWKMWRYLVGPDYLKRYCVLRGVQPSLKAMWSMPEFSLDKSGPKWAALAKKMQPGNSLDSGFSAVELGSILSRAWGPIRDDKADIKKTLADVEKQANDFLKTNPQWSILSAQDYKEHPEWTKSEG